MGSPACQERCRSLQSSMWHHAEDQHCSALLLASLVAEAGLGEGAWALEEQAAGLEGMGALVAVVGSAGEVGTV